MSGIGDAVVLIQQLVRVDSRSETATESGRATTMIASARRRSFTRQIAASDGRCANSLTRPNRDSSSDRRMGVQAIAT